MTAIAPKPAEKLTAKNSHLYIATKAPKDGKFDDSGAKSIRFRAIDDDHAKILAKTRNLRLEGRHISTHRRDEVGWHVKTGCYIRRTSHKLYYFQRLIESGKVKSDADKFKLIAAHLNKLGKQPIELCAGDYSSVEEAQKSFNKE